ETALRQAQQRCHLTARIVSFAVLELIMLSFVLAPWSDFFAVAGCDAVDSVDAAPVYRKSPRIPGLEAPRNRIGCRVRHERKPAIANRRRCSPNFWLILLAIAPHRQLSDQSAPSRIRKLLRNG